MIEWHFILPLFLTSLSFSKLLEYAHCWSWVSKIGSSYIWRAEVWLGARRGELYAVSMGNIYSCLWMQLHSNRLKKTCWTGYTMYLLIWTSFEKTTTILLFLARFPEETWLERSQSLWNVYAMPLSLYGLRSSNQIWQKFYGYVVPTQLTK